MESYGDRKHIKAIYLDDDAGQAHLLARFLGKIDWLDADVHHYTRPDRALAALLSGKGDLLFLDHHLGTAESGLDVLKELREGGYDGPIIMLTNRDDDMLVMNFHWHGADAYLCKSDLDPARIASTIQVALTLPHRTSPRILKDQNRTFHYPDGQ
ncbi:MAG: hypothetical protein CMJ89_01100 [Planctomycetes bacterium]|jgi:DNA-binding response OmpR family regulator|nr:hypothetical protein [Planctomycetota bacterium]